MSGGEWPEDPSDPRCPTCGEPVSATASYCMHCESDLPAENFEPAEATATPDDVPVDEMTEANPGMPTGDESDAGGGAATDEPAAGDGTAVGPTTPGEESDGADDDEGALLDPDSLLDDVSTVMVAVVAAPLAAVLAGLVALWFLPAVVESAALWLGLAAGAGGGLWIGRSRTVFGAARKSGVALGGLLALVPLGIGVALPFDTVQGSLVAAVTIGVFLWPVALVVGGLGWLLGKGGVESDESTA